MGGWRLGGRKRGMGRKFCFGGGVEWSSFLSLSLFVLRSVFRERVSWG
jgi:hypothetical protein